MAEPVESPVSRRSRLASLLPAGGLGRSVSILVGGAVVAQGLVALSYVVINRLYSPTSFGQYGAATALVAVLVTVGCLRYDVAIPLPRDENRAANLVALSILVSAALTVVFGLVLLVAGGPILGVFHADALLPYAWLLLAAQFGGSVYLALTSFAIRHKQFGTIARTRVTQSVASIATQIGIGLVSGSPAGLVAGDAVGATAGSGRLGSEARRVSRAALSQVSLSGVRAAARRYQDFAILSSPAALLNSIGFYAPLLLLVALYGARTGGLFAFGQRLILAPLSLLTLSIAQVFVAEAAILARDDPAGLRPLFSRTMRRLITLGTPIVLLLAVAAPLLTGPVFGSRWEPAGVYVTILAPFYLALLATSPLGGTLDVLERQDLHLIREVARVTITCGAIVAAAALELSAVQAVAVLSVAGSIAYVLYGLISWYAIVRAGDPDPRLLRWTDIYAAQGDAVARAPLPAGARREVLDVRTLEAVFVDSPAQTESARELLTHGHLGIVIVNESTWIAHGWMSVAEMPPHLPRQIGVAPWIFHCRSREPQEQSANYPILVSCLLTEARRRGLGGNETVYIDAPVSNADVRLRIMDAGFKPAGRLFTVRLPRMQRPIGRWTVRRKRHWPFRMSLGWAMLIVGIVAAAAAGFIIGQSSGAPDSRAVVDQHASVEGLQVSLPSGWRMAPPRAVPDIGLRDELTLAPKRSGGMLVIGSADTTDPSLLPQPLLAALRSTPVGQIVTLGALRFYGYLNLSPRNQGAHESVYALPTTVGTIIGECISQRASPSFSSSCERVLGTLRLTSGSVLPLAPSVSYARALNEVIGQLNIVRSTAGSQLRTARDPKAQATAANRLAVAQAAAASALRRVSAGTAGAANSALAGALRLNGDAYSALARAAAANDARSYRTAEASLARATIALNSAFAALSKLGYRLG